MTGVTAEQLGRARGCLLGLVLGDALGAAGGDTPEGGALRATSAGQLACFTVEGVVRAGVRQAHRGICHPPSVVWHAYLRWAAGLGVLTVRPDMLDGWLARVPVLAARRGPAPATEAALRGRRMGEWDRPAGTSLGAHALTRVLPVGLIEPWVPTVASLAAEFAVTTHAVEAAEVAGVGAAIVAGCRAGRPIEAAVEPARREHAARAARRTDLAELADALDTAASKPAEPGELARLAVDARASSALAGAVYVAACFPAREQVRHALSFAAASPHSRDVAPAVGALLGATHGCDALPVDLVSRLELAWVADVLARDLLSQFVDGPSGSEYAPAADPHWWDRYPGG
ncbi:ADP-ribosylglycohydrolase family protein [Micromonospora okii]|uniref:ADP-ribosylglycohydrolase family protein n=1 Tax=Micromonospora okii TaxID=1182970 RepID=UPI001E654022|nr:ADP-ribosylglycohydrolase family protein [Micromonospora okii]